MKFKWFGTKARKIAFLKVNMQGLMDQFWFIVVRISFIPQKKGTELIFLLNEPIHSSSVPAIQKWIQIRSRSKKIGVRSGTGTIAFSSLTCMVYTNISRFQNSNSLQVVSIQAGCSFSRRPCLSSNYWCNLKRHTRSSQGR